MADNCPRARPRSLSCLRALPRLPTTMQTWFAEMPRQSRMLPQKRPLSSLPLLAASNAVATRSGGLGQRGLGGKAATIDRCAPAMPYHGARHPTQPCCPTCLVCQRTATWGDTHPYISGSMLVLQRRTAPLLSRPAPPPSPLQVLPVAPLCCVRRADPRHQAALRALHSAAAAGGGRAGSALGPPGAAVHPAGAPVCALWRRRRRRRGGCRRCALAGGHGGSGGRTCTACQLLLPR